MADQAPSELLQEIRDLLHELPERIASSAGGVLPSTPERDGRGRFRGKDSEPEESGGVGGTKWRATERLALAGGAFMQPLADLGRTLQNIRRLSEAWDGFQKAFADKPARPSSDAIITPPPSGPQKRRKPSVPPGAPSPKTAARTTPDEPLQAFGAKWRKMPTTAVMGPEFIPQPGRPVKPAQELTGLSQHLDRQDIQREIEIPGWDELLAQVKRDRKPVPPNLFEQRQNEARVAGRMDRMLGALRPPGAAEKRRESAQLPNAGAGEGRLLRMLGGARQPEGAERELRELKEEIRRLTDAMKQVDPTPDDAAEELAPAGPSGRSMMEQDTPTERDTPHTESRGGMDWSKVAEAAKTMLAGGARPSIAEAGGVRAAGSATVEAGGGMESLLALLGL